MKTTKLALALGLTAAMTAASAVQATTLRFASGYPSGSITSEALAVFKDQLAENSDGELDVRIFELSLLNLNEASAGVRDGIADMAVVLTPYFPRDYPNTNMVSEVSMSVELAAEPPTQAGLVYTGAMSEYILHHCTDCRDEFTAQNQLFLGSAATPPYSLLCRSRIDSMDTLRGKSLRTSGAQWARWAESMGANPITMSVNEIYEGLSQGVVDCSVQSTSELSVFNLYEVIDDITLNYPSGVFSGVGSANMNLQSWQGLSLEQREAMLRSVARLSAEFSWGYEAGAQENEETARGQGIGITAADEEMHAANRAFIEADLQNIATTYAERYRVTDTEEKIRVFRELLDKWNGLINQVESGEELAVLYWDEIFSKIDPASYGQ